MQLKGLVDEDIVNYYKTSMYLIFPHCSFKCDKECGSKVCQNSSLSSAPTIEIAPETICERYINNPITSAIVCAGLEPFDSKFDLLALIDCLRRKFECNDEIKKRTNINLLDDRLNFYFTNLLDKEPTQRDIEKMRAELGFDDEPKSIRSSSLVEAIRYSEKDECVCCKDRYDIADRTHVNPKTERYYFEVHHVVSLGDNKELDDENNMVKLCPGCHRALKRGSCSKEEQKSMIRDIFTNAPKTLEFAKCFFDNTDYEEVVELTQRNLN